MSGAEFWQVSFGNVLTILSIIVGGTFSVALIKGEVKNLSERMTRVELTLTQLGVILVEQGKQAERINMLQEKIAATNRRIDKVERRLDNVKEGEVE